MKAQLKTHHSVFRTCSQFRIQPNLSLSLFPPPTKITPISNRNPLSLSLSVSHIRTSDYHFISRRLT